MVKSHKSCMEQAEIIDTFGTYREPKFVYVPKVPRPKNNAPIAKGVETVKNLEEIPLLNRIRNETPIDLTPFSFIPRSIFIKPLFESLLKTTCTIEDLFHDLDDGSIDTT